MSRRKLLLSGVTTRRSLFVAACSMVGMALAALVASEAPSLYETTATVMVASVTRPDSSAAAGANPLTETNDAQQRVLTLGELATSNVVLERVIVTAGLPDTPTSLRERVSAQAIPQTVLVEITAQDPDRTRARDIANTMALELDGYVQELNDQTPGSAAMTSARLVDPALLPTEPASPRPAIMLALGLVGGFAGGLILTAAMVRGDHLIRTERGVQRVTGLPGLGVVPRVRGWRLTPLDVATEPATVEAFKNIRNNVLQRVPADKSVLAIVSTESSQGKTALSLGLAQALASEGRSVLMVDGDLRNHHLSTVLQLEETASWVAPSARLSEPHHNIVKGAFDSVDVLFFATEPGDLRIQPGHGPGVGSFASVVDQVRQDYDVVLVDTADLEGTVDSAMWVKHADAAILVVPHGRSEPRELTLALDAIHQVGGDVLGTVLTLAPRSARG